MGSRYVRGVVLGSALLVWASIGAGSARAQRLRGRLAYLQGGRVRVMSLPTGRWQTVTGSQGAEGVTISPSGGTVIFLKPSLNKSSYTYRAFLSRPPYRSSRPLPAPLNAIGLARTVWTRDGSAALFPGYPVAFLYRPATGKVTKLAQSDDGTISPDGRFFAYAKGGDVKVRDLRTGRETVLLAWKKPAPLLNVLRAAT